MNRDEIMIALQQEYVELRAANYAIFEEHTREACQRCPGLSELLETRHSAVLSGIRESILRHSAPGGMAERMADWNRQIAEKLAAGGFPADYLQPVYTCAVCKDEGYVYNPSRTQCECYKKRLAARMIRETGVVAQDHCFENFDETVFSSEKTELGPSQRQIMRKQRKLCEEYADSYPETGAPNILLQGKSGLGKTYLMECMAHRLAERGFLPMYITAYRYFEMARQAYMENNSERLSAVLNAPVLLIDDLGTEPLMNNVTVEQLFNLLNERGIAGRHTVLSTNLNPNELRDRYTERVASRLMDRSRWQQVQLYGDDVRDRRVREARG